MSEQDFSNLDPTIRAFGEYLVRDMELGLGKRLDKIEKRLDEIENKLDAAITGNQVLMGWISTMDALVMISIKTRSEKEVEFISEAWNRITAFENIEGPPIAKEAALKSYEKIKEFLEKPIV